MVDFQTLLSRACFSIAPLALCAFLPGCLLFSTVHAPCERASECGDNQVCLDGRCGGAKDGGGVRSDGGVGTDGGRRDDAGVVADGGFRVDAGNVLDGGQVNDGGLPDAGFDAGTDAGRDAGLDAGVDAGPIEPLGVFPQGWMQLGNRSADDTQCLDSGRLPRDVVTLRDCNQELTTEWRAVEVDVGRYTLHVRYQGSHRCLDGNTTDAFVGPCRPSPNQIWRLVEVDGVEDTYYLKNEEGGVDGCLGRDGPGFQRMPCAAGQSDQQWVIVPLADGGCPVIQCGIGEVCDFINGDCNVDTKEQYCFDGVDEDGNGRADCADSACVDRGECFSPVTVPNASFEEFDGSNGTPNPAIGWTCNDGNGGCGTEPAFVNPSGQFFAEPTDGDRYHFLNLPNFSTFNPSFTESDNGEIGPVEAGLYWMQVAIGRRLNNETTNDRIDIEFRAASEVFTTTPVINPQQFETGTWNDVDAEALVLPGQEAVGRDLRLRFSAYLGTDGRQAQIDHVRLQHSPLGVLVLPHGSFEGPIDELPQVDGWASASGAVIQRVGELESGQLPSHGEAMLELVKAAGLPTVAVDQVIEAEPAIPYPIAEEGVYGIAGSFNFGVEPPASGTVTLRLFQAGVGPVVTATLDFAGAEFASADWVTLSAANTLRIDNPSTAGTLVVQLTLTDDASEESTIYVDDLRTFFVPLP